MCSSDLKGVELNLPALRERRGDVRKLIEYFVSRSAHQISFTESALTALEAYDWHGNVRELEQLVKSLVSGSLGKISLGDLPAYVQTNRNPYVVEEETRLYSRNVASFVQKHGLRKLIQVLERDAFEDLYRSNGENLTKTQLALGISKSAAYRILEDIQGEKALAKAENV